MLSVEEVRKLMDGGKEYTDVEVEQIRDNMRILAELAFESWMKEKSQEKNSDVS
jgi:hypothetical protein